MGQKSHDRFVSLSLPLIAVKTFVKSKVYSKPETLSFRFFSSHICSFYLSEEFFCEMCFANSMC